MACFSIAACRLEYPQLWHISECTIYWLMAVSSSASSSFRTGRSFSLPFMGAPSRNADLVIIGEGNRRGTYQVSCRRDVEKELYAGAGWLGPGGRTPGDGHRRRWALDWDSGWPSSDGWKGFAATDKKIDDNLGGSVYFYRLRE